MGAKSMKLLRNLRSQAEINSSVVTIGNFDGVHRGHQYLLKSLKAKAEQLQLPAVVILFEPQPTEFFLKSRAPVRLFSLREKLQVFQEAHIDYVLCLHFTPKLATLSAQVFAVKYLFSFLKAKYIIVGKDFRFGHAREGDFALLQQLSSEFDCEVEQVSEYVFTGQRISSTAIRIALQAGQLDLATNMLGQPYSTFGRVISGKGLARQWGIATANVHLPRQRLPLQGIFCVKVEWRGKLLEGVANLGYCPTLEGKELTLEVHLFHFNEELYGEKIKIYFLHKLRDEIKFSSVDELIAQIQSDIISTEAYFKLTCK